MIETLIVDLEESESSYLLSNGELFHTQNIELTQELLTQHSIKQQAAFYNAQRFALFTTLKYYEGLLKIKATGSVQKWAWLVDDFGRVVDPTSQEEGTYYGIPITTADIFALFDTFHVSRSLFFTHYAESEEKISW
jgi:L-rhamnose mutarotase